MNTVVADRFFKTVAMEKEIFVCGQQGGGTTQIRDVETFIEIVENASGGLVGIPTFLLSTCVSNPPTGLIRCKNTVPPTNPVNATPLQGCQVATFNEPDDPVVMNTAVNNGVVKTIKVDKSWYTCDTPGGLVIQDIYLFNEILERASKNAAGNATLAPYARRIIGVECTKHPTEAIISSCNLFPVK